MSKGVFSNVFFFFNILRTDRFYEITPVFCMWKLVNDAFVWCCQKISMWLLALANGIVSDNKVGFSFNRKKANLRKEGLQISGSWWFKTVAQSVEYISVANIVMV